MSDERISFDVDADGTQFQAKIDAIKRGVDIRVARRALSDYEQWLEIKQGPATIGDNPVDLLFHAGQMRSSLKSLLDVLDKEQP